MSYTPELTDPFTLRASTEHTGFPLAGWWLVLEDPNVPRSTHKDAFSVPINGSRDNGDVLYPLLGVSWKEMAQMEPRKLTDLMIYQAVEYALQQAISRREPISETALNILNWVAELPALRANR